MSAAQHGDEDAWSRLVQRFARSLREIACSYRLSPHDVDDVVQATWLQVFKHLEQLREPAALPGWLVTTARREAIRLLQRPTGEVSTDDPTLGDGPCPELLEAGLVAAERRTVLAGALARLPERHRRLMTLLAAQAAPDYQEISAGLGIPAGSIGPIRARCLVRLARNADLIALRASDSD